MCKDTFGHHKVKEQGMRCRDDQKFDVQRIRAQTVALGLGQESCKPTNSPRAYACNHNTAVNRVPSSEMYKGNCWNKVDGCRNPDEADM